MGEHKYLPRHRIPCRENEFAVRCRYSDQKEAEIPGLATPYFFNATYFLIEIKGLVMYPKG
jgi:hypothetical protein